MGRYQKIVVIPDTHCEPGDKCERATWIGNLIAAEEPTHVIHLGDIAEMGSMSFYDPIKSTAFSQDCEVTRLFQEKLVEAGGDAWEKATTVFLEGNHEARIRRRVTDAPELMGAIDLKHLGVFEYFDKVLQWKGGPEIYETAGIMFTHYIQSRMGRAIGGLNHARTLLLNTMQSVVVGHSHTLHYHSIPLHNNRHIHGLVAGCCFEHEHAWAGQNDKKYWRGIAVLHDAKNGEFDLELVSIHRLKREYK